MKTKDIVSTTIVEYDLVPHDKLSTIHEWEGNGKVLKEPTEVEEKPQMQAN